jgi:sugar phosphate isomerase/epimerase
MDVHQGFTVEGRADLDAALAFAADHGFDFVELNMENGFPRSRVDPDRVRAALDRHDLDLVVHLPYRIDPGSPHEHARDGACRELEAAIDVAAGMGAERGVFHATTWAHPETWDPETVRTAILESVRRVSAYGAERGVEAVAENLKGKYFDAGDFPDLFERTDAAVCLDTGHAHVTGHGADWQADLLREHGDRVAHVHLNETRRDDEDEHLPVGIGRFDFGTLADAMRETGWAGTCTHEVFAFDHAYAGHGKRAFDRLLDGEGS